MQIHESDADMAEPPRRPRGRPSTGVRKARVQALLDVEDVETIEAAAATLDKSVAELGRVLIKGEMAWADVVKAAKKGRR
jgi:hypothetical protein